MIWTLLGTAAVAMVISMAAYVSAFESNTINVTSFVKQSIITSKAFAAAPTKVDLDKDGDIDCDQGEFDPDINVDPVTGEPLGPQDGCYHLDPALADVHAAFLANPGVLQVGIKYCWDVTITLTNNNPEKMWQVVLKDKFSAEMTDPQLVLGDVPVAVHEMNQNKGKSKKKRSSGAILITWWVDYDPAEDAVTGPDFDMQAFIDDDGTLDDPDDNFKTPAPGSVGLRVGGPSDTMVMYVCTGLNPSGKQSYTSAACYNFNSGLTVKWLVGDPDGEMVMHQMSMDGNRLAVLATLDGTEPDPDSTQAKQSFAACQKSIDALPDEPL